MDFERIVYILISFIVFPKSSIVSGQTIISSETPHLFWKMFHLLQTKNNLDIKTIIMISNDDDCECFTDFCNSIKKQIMEENSLIPYTCISKSMLKSTRMKSMNHTKKEPAFMLLLSTGKEFLDLVLEIFQLSINLHCWMLVQQVRLLTNETTKTSLPESGQDFFDQRKQLFSKTVEMSFL